MRYPLVIMAMHGMGDSIYQRPFVRHYAAERGEVFLETSWPELFEDIGGLHFVEPDPRAMEFRTQTKNIRVQGQDRWVRPPLRAERIRVTYRLDKPGETVLDELRRVFKLPNHARIRFDAPDFGRPPVRYGKYAVIRPVTLRKEWLNFARPPLPEYVARASELLSEAGYKVVSVADVEDRAEWVEGSPPPADREFLAGELDVRRLGALVQHASVVVGGVGWIVPFSAALRTPAVIIAGGQGGYNAPEVVTDPRCMDLSRFGWVMPDNYCRCRKRLHACKKTITDFDAKLSAELRRVTDGREAAA